MADSMMCIFISGSSHSGIYSTNIKQTASKSQHIQSTSLGMGGSKDLTALWCFDDHPSFLTPTGSDKLIKFGHLQFKEGLSNH